MAPCWWFGFQATLASEEMARQHEHLLCQCGNIERNNRRGGRVESGGSIPFALPPGCRAATEKLPRQQHIRAHRFRIRDLLDDCLPEAQHATFLGTRHRFHVVLP